MEPPPHLPLFEEHTAAAAGTEENTAGDTEGRHRADTGPAAEDIGPIVEAHRKAEDTDPAVEDIGPIAGARRKAEDTDPVVEDIGPIVVHRKPDTDPAAVERHSAARLEVRDSSAPAESALAAGPSFRPTAGSDLFQFAANRWWPRQVR